MIQDGDREDRVFSACEVRPEELPVLGRKNSLEAAGSQTGNHLAFGNDSPPMGIPAVRPQRIRPRDGSPDIHAD